jgi:hypothetical protein
MSRAGVPAFCERSAQPRSPTRRSALSSAESESSEDPTTRYGRPVAHTGSQTPEKLYWEEEKINRALLVKAERDKKAADKKTKAAEGPPAISVAEVDRVFAALGDITPRQPPRALGRAGPSTGPVAVRSRPTYTSQHRVLPADSNECRTCRKFGVTDSVRVPGRRLCAGCIRDLDDIKDQEEDDLAAVTQASLTPTPAEDRRMMEEARKRSLATTSTPSKRVTRGDRDLATGLRVATRASLDDAYRTSRLTKARKRERDGITAARLASVQGNAGEEARQWQLVLAAQNDVRAIPTLRRPPTGDEWSSDENVPESSRPGAKGG